MTLFGWGRKKKRPVKNACGVARVQRSRRRRLSMLPKRDWFCIWLREFWVAALRASIRGRGFCTTGLVVLPMVGRTLGTLGRVCCA